MALLCHVILAIPLVWATPLQASPPSAAIVAPIATVQPAEQVKPAQAVAARDGAIRELGPFAAARFAPADATMLVRVERAGRLRRDLASRPIAECLTSFAHGGAIARAWSSLAQSINFPEAQLFDECFGRDVTFMKRAPGEWVVMTSLAEERTREMMRMLNVRVREPRYGLAVSELPEQEILLASDGGQVLIGPSRHPQLFHDVLERWGTGDRSTAPSLARNADFVERLNELDCRASRATLAAFVRHNRPLGGCSMFIADVRGDDVSIRQSARFNNPLFASPVTRLECDFSPLALFADRALVAIMQPRDVGDGPVDAFLTASLRTGLVSPEMRSNLADRRMLVIGEADGRQMPDAKNILTTTFVACLELKDATGAPQQLDRQMMAIASEINRIGQGAMLVRMPDTGAMSADQARHTDLGAAEQWFTGGFPVMRTVSLNWAVADHDHGKWFVIGSHPHALKETLNALAIASSRDERLVGRFDSCGVANGLRLGRHMQSWSEEVDEFADAPNVEVVRSTLKTFADLASGLTDCRWQMARPTANTLKLEVQAKLAPAQTSGK